MLKELTDVPVAVPKLRRYHPGKGLQMNDKISSSTWNRTTKRNNGKDDHLYHNHD
jgi:hypothetical protein